MLKLKSLKLIPVLFGLVLLLVVVGCSSDDSSGSSDSSGKSNLVDKLIDTASAKIADKFVESAFTKATFASTTDSGLAKVTEVDDLINPEEFSDILITENKLYALAGSSLIVHDFNSGENVTVQADDQLTTIIEHQGDIYVGGKFLYTLNLYSLIQQEGDYTGGITSLYSYDHLLMVGTESALYSVSVFGREKLADDITVTALTGDRTGLWVGTDASGLYRWDGTDFKRRYLLRDSSLFDNVNSLDFQHNHLYVGTTNGFHIYDGGRWLNLSTEDGLPANNVTSVDASEWVIYIGTDLGVVSYFNNEFTPIKRLEDMGVSKVLRNKNKTFVASLAGSVQVNSRVLLKTLIEPGDNEQTGTLTLMQ